MNQSPAVSDQEDEYEFDDNDIIYYVIIDEAENNETQVDSEEAVEDEELNNNNDFFEDINVGDGYEYNTLYVRCYTRVRHCPNNLIPKMTGLYVPYEEGKANLQVEDMINITMEVENKNTVDDKIHACVCINIHQSVRCVQIMRWWCSNL